MVTESKKHSVEIWLYSLDITPFLFIFSMVSQAKSWLCSVNLPASFCISHSLPGLSQHTSAAVLIPLSNLLLYQMLAQVTVPANAGHAETMPGGWTGPDSGTLPLLLLPGFHSVAWVSCCNTPFVSKKTQTHFWTYLCKESKEWGTFVNRVGLILIYLPVHLWLWFLFWHYLLIWI